MRLRQDVAERNMLDLFDSVELGIGKDASDGNSTISTISFIPTRLDSGRSLTCRASNHLVQNGVEEHTVKLNVFYVPILHLSLGSNLNPEDIEEGDDVYFECKVNANPWAYKVLWKHNGQVMQANQKAGVIMSTTALALQGVTRSQAGNYSCVASNVEDKPICRYHQKRVYGVAKMEKAKVVCEVESYPPPDDFKWLFNNSAEATEVPAAKYKSGLHNSMSILTYAPLNEMDYGTVMCWANNLAGRQQEPCVFHIIPAGKPDPPYNCTIVNMTIDSLEVECTEGFDGGQPQYFLLEVYDSGTGALLANVSAKFPVFIVSGLDPGKTLKMIVFSANNKGRSEQVALEGFTLNVAEKQTVLSLGTKDDIEITPILGVLIGVVTALLLVTVIILGALKIRAARRNGSRMPRPGFLPGKEKVALPLRSESEDLFEKDDRNPDVIPSNKDSDYQLGSAAQTPGLNNSASAPGGYELAVPVSAPHTPQQIPAPGPLQEAYMARDRNYPPQHIGNEVTYAELALVRPNSLEPLKNGGNAFGTLRSREDPTIYAQIDHNKRLPPRTSPLVSPASAMFPARQGLYHREVVTVRTPLMGFQQESCV
ncbi:unnamed protein product [Phaedon cochleariae]|uniref:Ig-like domain-containing protein n=1 Tax=Phaedon cochleariae TaxID=80249 RepID=A0A9N9SAY5_PHACE|nr:unnamed protein product [Phaedon cochleariae]